MRSCSFPSRLLGVSATLEVPLPLHALFAQTPDSASLMGSMSEAPAAPKETCIAKLSSSNVGNGFKIAISWQRLRWNVSVSVGPERRLAWNLQA